VSQHLRVLRDVRLLHERREVPAAVPHPPEGFREVRAFPEELWDGRLQTLKVEAEREQRRRDRG
jgi:hypothetical protein